MATGIKFPQANMVMQAPEGSDDVYDLAICKTDSHLVSKWEFDDEELEFIAENKFVYLAILGDQMPPVFITGTDLLPEPSEVPAIIVLTEHEKNKNDRQEFAEKAILKLPEDDPMRNTWLLNYGKGEEAQKLRESRQVEWSEEYQATTTFSTMSAH